MVFSLLGNPIVAGEKVREKTAVKLSDGDELTIQSGDEPVQVLFMSSVRLNEPVVWGGPIVMNTREELNEAFDDLNRGTFLRDKMVYDQE
jgi:redox-sensitive bicupin YhaK (pirin superfamily)